MMVKHSPHPPLPKTSCSPATKDLDGARTPVQGSLALESLGRGPGGSSTLTDYSGVEEVYLRMWGEHGKGPGAGQQGGNQEIRK